MRSNLLCAALVLACVPALSAQDSTTILKGTSLTIKGSAGVDDLTIEGVVGLTDGEAPTPVDVLVTPNNGSTLNGATDPVTFPGVLKLKIVLSAGSDVLHVTDFDFASNPVTLNAGPGDDQVFLTNTITGAFKFIGSSGNDTFNLSGSHLGSTKVTGSSGVLTMPAVSTYFHDLKLTSGPEIDVLNWNDVTVDFNFKLNTGGGSDLVTFTDGTVGAETTLKLGGGNDEFTDDAGDYGEFVTMIAGGGDDDVVFEDSLIGNALNVKLNGGLNKLTFRAQDDDVIVGNSTTITGGGQLDTVKMEAFVPPRFILIGNDLIVALKSGANELQLTGDVETGNDLRYTGGGLDDVVDMDGTSVGNDCNLVLSNGFNDAILNDCSVGNDLRITAGSGDDTVQLTGTTTVGGLTLISLGGGNNIEP
ncbi:MAG TPA: hypothetical protein VFY71_14235 [Planctomycetota bacterium]|nr:hypothetical protein [Planctomycetota bacterium]